MKKIATFIIFLFVIFSSFSAQAANEGAIESILNLEYGPTSYELSLIKLDNYYFRDAGARKVYLSFKNYDSLAKKELMKKFENDDYDYYTMNAISRNYKEFVYYTNKLFYFLDLVDKNPSLNEDKEIQYHILVNYRASKSNFDRVKALLKK